MYEVLGKSGADAHYGQQMQYLTLVNLVGGQAPYRQGPVLHPPPQHSHSPHAPRSQLAKLVKDIQRQGSTGEAEVGSLVTHVCIWGIV